MRKVLITVAGVLVVVVVALLLLTRTSFQKGSWSCQNGQWVKVGNPTSAMPTTPCLSSQPAGIQNSQAAGGKIDSITISSPKKDAVISSVLTITGKAKSSNNKFSWRVRNSDGTILIEGLGDITAATPGVLGDFKVVTSYPKPKAQTGTIEVYSYKSDGTEEYSAKVPVKFTL